MLRLISASWTPLLLLLALVGLVNSQALLGAANEATVAKSRISLEQTMLLQGANNNVNLLAVNETETDGTETTVATATLAPVISNATTLVPGGTATQAAATCPKTPDALLLVKRCRFFTEIMGVQPKSASSTSPAVIYPPRSLIVAVTVFCKVPDAEATFTDCVDETFATTSCSTPVKSQLHTIATDYWSRYCVNVDDNIQTLKYLFAKIPVHLVDEEWEVGATFTNQTGLCVNADDLQDLVINPCARWYNRVIGSGSRDRPLDVYLNVATTSSDIGLQCVKRRMLRSTNCGADLIYLMLRALYVFQGLPGVSIPLVYLDPSFKRQNPSPAGVCPPRHVVAIWSNQFVQSVNRGVRYCPLTAGATDLLTTDTVEIVGILNVDQGVTSIDIRFFNPTNQHDPLVWYKATNGQLPTTFTSAVSRQSTITIEPVSGASIPTDTQVVKISDAGVGQMVIYVSVRSRQFYDVIVSATDFDFNYATGVLVHSCSRTEDIDYKTEVVSLESAKLTSQFADECEDACRSITTVGYHESCLIACMRRGGDSRIVNSINMLLGFTSELGRVCNITQYAPPIVISGASNPAVGSGFVLLASAIIATAAAALMV